MKKLPFTGSGVALVTPFKADGTPNFEKLREEILARNASSTLEQLFSQIKEGEVKNLNLIIKGDVQG